MSRHLTESEKSSLAVKYFLAAFAFSYLVSKLSGLQSGFALDDYSTASQEADGLWKFFLAQGRFTFSAVHVLISESGLKQPHMAGLGFFLCAWGFAWIYSDTLRELIPPQPAAIVSIAALLGSHPFFTEYVSFRQSAFPMGLCLMATAGALRYCLTHRSTGSIPALAASFALIIAAGGINQLAFTFYCIAIFANEIVRSESDPLHRRMFHSLLRSAGFGFVAAVGYVLVAVIAASLAGAGGNGRAGLVAPAQWGERISQIAALMQDVAVGTHPLIPATAAFLTLAAWVAFVAPTSAFPGRAKNVLVSVLALLVCIGYALAPIILSAVWWPVPRVLIAVPFALAVSLAVAARGAPRYQVMTGAVFLLAASVVLSGRSDAILQDQQRLNRWDMERAREVVFEIQSRGVDTRRFTIVLHRPTWAYEVAPTMPIGDLNLSAASVGWSVEHMFEEASGQGLQVRLATPAELNCDAVARFPSEQSISIAQDEVHVCL